MRQCFILIVGFIVSATILFIFHLTWQLRNNGDDTPSIQSNPNGARAPVILFGSQTCPIDVLPVDQMLPHQLKQSASRPFDHRILIVDNAVGRATAKQSSQHAAMLSRLVSMQLVDEIVHNEDLKLQEFAKRSLCNKTAEAALALPEIHDLSQTKGHLVFLAKCLDGGYDHCVWLDSDIFVHRDIVPWVDEAIHMRIRDPNITIGKPNSFPGDDRRGFSQRYFVYHKEGLQRLLPLEGTLHNTFERLINDNLDKLEPPTGDSLIQRQRNDISWVIHPPDDKTEISQMLEACDDQGLSALFAIVEQGSEHGESAYMWRDHDNNENMDAATWLLHIYQHCGGHSSLHQFLAPLY